jgi:hypothetical protein
MTMMFYHLSTTVINMLTEDSDLVWFYNYLLFLKRTILSINKKVPRTQEINIIRIERGEYALSILYSQ